MAAIVAEELGALDGQSLLEQNGMKDRFWRNGQEKLLRTLLYWDNSLEDLLARLSRSAEQIPRKIASLGI